jgi:hypothetical protein
MGKRSDFKRVARDAYATPAEAVAPLLSLLAPHTQFVEPCAGEGKLIERLAAAGHRCVGAFDLPDDARVKRYAIPAGALIVTNPPYFGRRADLHPLIVNLSNQAEAWLLLPHDWLCNLSSAPLMRRLRAVKPIGRVRWITDSPSVGFENYDWMLFGRPSAWAATRLFGRDVANGHGACDDDATLFDKSAINIPPVPVEAAS